MFIYKYVYVYMYMYIYVCMYTFGACFTYIYCTLCVAWCMLCIHTCLTLRRFRFLVAGMSEWVTPVIQGTFVGHPRLCHGPQQ